MDVLERSALTPDGSSAPVNGIMQNTRHIKIMAAVSLLNNIISPNFI